MVPGYRVPVIHTCRLGGVSVAGWAQGERAALRASGYGAAMRRTEQKQAIKDALDDAGRPLSAQEVLDAAGAEVPSLGLATVYRNLKTLTKAGWLNPVELPGQPVRYERAHLQHHHHFMCEACERVFDVPGCSVHAAAHGVPDGFVVERHEVTFYGRCAECAAG